MRAGAVFVLLAMGAAIAGCGSGGSTSTRQRPRRPEPLAVYAAGVRIAVVRPGERRIDLPARIEVRRGRVRMRDTIPRLRARRVLAAGFAAHDKRIDMPVVPLWTRIAVQPVRQVLHNDCEATALSMLLATAGIRAGQLELQSRIPRSGPSTPSP